MSTLAETTAASLVVTKYYQTLFDEAPESVKQELISLTYLMIGTCGLDDLEAAYLCADRACRVFVPKALREAGLAEEAEKLEKLEEINSEATAYAASRAAYDARSAYATNAAAWSARYAARYAARSATNAAATNAAAADVAAWSVRSARSAASSAATARSAAWPEAIQLFKDLCALPRER